jgi:hypothetical protein
MEGTYFDKALLVTCIDGLGRFNKENGALIYRKDADTLGVPIFLEDTSLRSFLKWRCAIFMLQTKRGDLSFRMFPNSVMY